MTTHPERLEIARWVVRKTALTMALRNYRGKTLESPGGTAGRHVFAIGTIQSLCGSLVISPAHPLESMPLLELATVTCVHCLRALAGRVVQS